MKILYLANIRIPTEKAHGIQIAKMVAAFAENGIDTTLLVPSANKNTDDVYTYYNVPRNFKVQTLSAPRVVNYGPIGFTLSTILFFISFLFLKRSTDTVVFVRDVYLALLLALFSIPFVIEIHQDFYNRFSAYILKKALLVIFITKGVKDKFISHGIQEVDNMVVLPDAVGEERFNLSQNKNMHREKAGLPQDGRIVLYSGHLYPWKGVDTLAETISKIPDDVLLVFVGGTPEDVARFRKQYGDNPRIKILGHKPYAEMAHYKQSADILVIPNSAKFDISKTYTSPLKLFSAMASEIPIIVSDLPSIREVVDESMVLFFTPDDSDDLAKKITFLFKNPEVAKQLTQNAVTEARKHTWKSRAATIKARIVDYI